MVGSRGRGVVGSGGRGVVRGRSMVGSLGVRVLALAGVVALGDVVGADLALVLDVGVVLLVLVHVVVHDLGAAVGQQDLVLACRSGRPERPFCRISAESFCRNSAESLSALICSFCPSAETLYFCRKAIFLQKSFFLQGGSSLESNMVQQSPDINCRFCLWKIVRIRGLSTIV